VGGELVDENDDNDVGGAEQGDGGLIVHAREGLSTPRYNFYLFIRVRGWTRCALVGKIGRRFSHFYREELLRGVERGRADPFQAGKA
jgi:hypothetical protein